MKIIADTLGPLNPFILNWQNNLNKTMEMELCTS